MFTFCCGTMSWPRTAAWRLSLQTAVSHRAARQAPGRRGIGIQSSPARAEGHRREERRAEKGRREGQSTVEREAALLSVSILKIANSLNLSTNYDILLYAEFPSHLQAEFTSDPDRRISPVVRISCRRINTGGESSVPCIRAPSIGPWKPSVRFGCRCQGVLWRCHPAPP